MKLFGYIIILTFSISCFSQGETGTVVYGLVSTLNNSKIDSVRQSSSKIKNQMVAKLLADSKHADPLNFELVYTSNRAYFKPLHNKHNQGQMTILKIASIASGAFFYDFEKSISINIFEYRNLRFHVEDSLSQFNWSITNETKYIGNYLCYKATGQRLFYASQTDQYHPVPLEAWFTHDIPISAGPDGVGGLPGLILELNLRTRTYFALKISFDDVLYIPSPDKEKVISRSEYNALKRQLYLKQ